MKVMSGRAPWRQVLHLKVVDFFRRTRALSLFEEFSRSQFYPREEIQSLQWRRLKKILDHAYRHVPYYQRCFKELDLHPDDIQSQEDFRKIPILTKDIIRREGKNLLARNWKSFHPRQKCSSGSTGEPLRYFLDENSHSALWAYIYRSWEAGGWKLGDKMVFLGGSSVFPSFSGFKRWCYIRLNRWLLLSSFTMNEKVIQGWLARLRKFNGRFMYAYSGSAYLFANYILEKGITDIRFQSVFTTGEILYPHFRTAIEKAFQCKVYDMYGGADGAGYAFECSYQQGLHLVAEDAFVEILKEGSIPAEENEEGELISTDLMNYAMPFIRYRVGDIVTYTSAACPCGRGLPLIKGVKGRSNDYVLTPSGTKVHASYLGRLALEFENIEQYLFIQGDEQTLEVYLKLRGPIEDWLNKLKTRIAKDIPDMNINLILTNTILKGENGKFKTVINRLKDQDYFHQSFDKSAGREDKTKSVPIQTGVNE